MPLIPLSVLADLQQMQVPECNRFVGFSTNANKIPQFLSFENCFSINLVNSCYL